MKINIPIPGKADYVIDFDIRISTKSMGFILPYEWKELTDSEKIFQIRDESIKVPTLQLINDNIDEWAASGIPLKEYVIKNDQEFWEKYQAFL